MAALFLRAKDVLDCGSGLYRVEIAERRLTPEEVAMLRQLFPTLNEEAYRLLDKEMLLDSIAEPEYVAAVMEKADPQPVKKMKKSKHPNYPELPVISGADDDT